MSGDVQPRKRKDKKRKKDELGVEEPRGTAAVLGEGDVFIHYQHDHGTGGHWCAKIIFFSLLAVLVTLVGLIILENRGLSELEANSVESRYAGVLEGWLEDVPDDDHHDEHTLELKHHDDELSQEIDQDEEENSDEHDQAEDEIDQDADDDNGQDDDDEDALDDDSDQDDDEDANQNEDDDNSEQNLDEADKDVVVSAYRRYIRSPRYESNDDTEDNDEDDNEEIDEYNDDEHTVDENDSIEDNEDIYDEGAENENADQTKGRYELSLEDENSIQSIEDDDDTEQKLIDDNENSDIDEYDDNDTKEDDENSKEQDENDTRENEDEEEHEDVEEDSREVEKLEEEISDEDTLLTEKETQDGMKEDEVSNEALEDVSDDDDEEYLELDDIDEPPPVVEHIKVPAGKPLVEVEEDPASEKPPDTLAEEEEYEKRQEELRRERDEASHQDGGNSIEEVWPGEPSESHWREQLDQAEEELRQGDWSSAKRRAGAAQLSNSARAKWLVARALDASAEARRDNNLLSQAITSYLDLLKMNQRLGDDILLKITERTLDRIRFRGNYLSAEPIYRLLIRRFPDVPDYRNNLTVTFLMANRADLAEEVIKNTLKRWPDDRVALAHYGFVLKTKHNRLEEAVDAFQKALKGDIGPAMEPRFYYHLGDSLLLLGRYAEAHEVHKRGAALGHFLSPAQRSLYNVERLKGQPWWNIEQTPYVKLAQALEKSWKQILKEGEAARSLYEKEKEGLKERGEWTQLDLFVRGQEIPNRCKRAPVTCSIVRTEPAAAGCRRGQVKFSLMEAGTHVRPHVGPTNCRLRMHLGLSNTKDTYIRVDQETRQWVAGKVLLFDDSFEHEVWHNGTGARLVLIVDVWHPDLTPAQRRALPAI